MRATRVRGRDASINSRRDVALSFSLSLSLSLSLPSFFLSVTVDVSVAHARVELLRSLADESSRRGRGFSGNLRLPISDAPVHLLSHPFFLLLTSGAPLLFRQNPCSHLTVFSLSLSLSRARARSFTSMVKRKRRLAIFSCINTP